MFTKRHTILIAAIAILIGSSIAYFTLLYPNMTVVPAFDERSLKLVIEGENVISNSQPKIVDGEILLPLDIVKKYFDPNIYWDEKLKKVTVTTKDRVIRMKSDSLNALINNKPVTLKIPVTVDNSVIFIPIEFLSDFYNIEIQYLKTNNIIMIDYKNKVTQIADVILPDTVIRKGKSIRYPIIKKFDLNSNPTEEKILRVYEKSDKWYKVRASDGAVGFIDEKYIKIKEVLPKNATDANVQAKQWKPEKGKINLVWDMMYESRPELSKMNKIEGLDVVSPTWFQLANENGELINRAYSKYIDWAHNNGYKVWALLSNDFGNPAMTKKFLNDTDARDTLIRKLLAYASLYKLDGINIDFENINKEDKNALTQFVREITPLLKEQGLVVSMDVTIPDGSDNWSLCYDRKALGQIVDYIMLMTYDQHWGTSPQSGSVAQITWVEKNLNKVLEVVPKEKLLLGVPFYTRLWKEETDKNGKIKVTNPKVLSMDAARKLIDENKAEVKWDEVSGQFYSEFKKENANYKIWLEDENSINLKSSLVQKYKLAGAAAWRKNDESKDVWRVLNKNLKIHTSYQEWVTDNKDSKMVFKNVLQNAK